VGLWWVGRFCGGFSLKNGVFPDIAQLEEKTNFGLFLPTTGHQKTTTSNYLV